MRIICAWCKKDLGEKAPFGNPAVSHGMCPDCEAKVNAELDEKDKFALAMKDAETCSMDELEAADQILNNRFPPAGGNPTGL